MFDRDDPLLARLFVLLFLLPMLFSLGVMCLALMAVAVHAMWMAI